MQGTKWREPQNLGLKITTNLRYLATGETYTSLHYQFRNGKTIISKFVVLVCRAIIAECMAEHLTCPTTPEGWKETETVFGLKWNVPHAKGALDGKHVATRKPPKSGNLYHNYKGFFCIVMLALIDAEYRFRWMNVGTEAPAQMLTFSVTVSSKTRLRMKALHFQRPHPLA